MSTVVTAKPPRDTVDFLLTHSHDVILRFSSSQVSFIPSEPRGGVAAALASLRVDSGSDG